MPFTFFFFVNHSMWLISLKIKKHHHIKRKENERYSYGYVCQIVKHYPLRSYYRNKATVNPEGVYIESSKCVCVFMGVNMCLTTTAMTTNNEKEENRWCQKYEGKKWIGMRKTNEQSYVSHSLSSCSPPLPIQPLDIPFQHACERWTMLYLYMCDCTCISNSHMLERERSTKCSLK